MLPDQVSNPGPLTYESGALPIALRGPAIHAMTTGCIAMNQMLRERYQSQVSLCKMNKFIGTWTA